MLKKNILKKNWQFKKIIDKKKQYVSNSLILYFQPSDDRLKIGISIPKKFANAVKRNKYKRQTKTILDQLNFYDLKFDAVLILRKKFINKSYQDKMKAVELILERLKNVK